MALSVSLGGGGESLIAGEAQSGQYFGGTEVTEAGWLKGVVAENARLKKLLAAALSTFGIRLHEADVQALDLK